jgi:hypothetical protein
MLTAILRARIRRKPKIMDCRGGLSGREMAGTDLGGTDHFPGSTTSEMGPKCENLVMSMTTPGGTPTIMRRVAMDRLALSQHTLRRAARQRLLRDAENFDEEVSFEPPSLFTSFDHLVGAGENTLLPIVHVELDNIGREMVLPRIDRSLSGIVPYFSARSETS